ncbi:MAG: HAD family hydrolase [Fibrobacterota bacterium]
MDNVCRFQGIIFDFDGTLVDTFPGIYCGWQKTFQRLGLPPIGENTVRAAIGPAKDAYLRLILGENYNQHQEQALELYRLFYKEECTTKTFVYPGIYPLLQRLQDRGMYMAIASNKPHPQVLQLTERFKFNPYFDPILAPEKVKEGKPEPDMFLACAQTWGVPPEAILVVGDTELDMEAGKRAGMPRAAALWGYSTREKLSALAPEFSADTPMDIYSYVCMRAL